MRRAASSGGIAVGFIAVLSGLLGCTLATDPLKHLPAPPQVPGAPVVVVRAFDDHRPEVGGTQEIGARKNFILFNWKQFRYQAPEPPGMLVARAFAQGLDERGVKATCENGLHSPFELRGRLDVFVADVVGRYGIRISGETELVDTTSTPARVVAQAVFREEMFRPLAMTSAWGSVPVMEEMFAEILPKVTASVLDSPTFRDALARRQPGESSL